MNVLDDVGLMKDELFVLVISMSNWSLRAKAKGYDVYIAPKAKKWRIRLVIVDYRYSGVPSQFIVHCVDTI